MPIEEDLLRSLDDEPRKPSQVDIGWAIAAGRRRRARRTAGYAGAAAVTVLALAGASVAVRLSAHAAPDAAATGAPRTTPTTTASAAPKAKADYTIPGTPGWTAPATAPPTSCTLERLPVPDNVSMALVHGADPAGRYLVGRSYPGGGSYQAVIWHDGQARKVMLPGDLEEQLEDANSTGTAVGWSYDDGGSVPYVYHDGKVSKLPGVRHGSAYAINDAGAIAGVDDDGHDAVVWPSATAKPIRLPVPAGTAEATAHDIDEDGTTVGNLDEGRAYVWFPDGTHRELPMPSVNGVRAETARVYTIRNGWATGMAHAANDKGGNPEAGVPDPRGKAGRAAQPWPVRWNVRTGEVRVFGELRTWSNMVNAHGWQVGTDQQGRAVLLTDGAPVVLPGLTAESTIPSTVSDDGRTVAGQSDDASGTIKAVAWRCR